MLKHCFITAAGFATRLNLINKGLLPLGDYVDGFAPEDITPIGLAFFSIVNTLDVRVTILTNGKYYQEYMDWVNKYGLSERATVLNNQLLSLEQARSEGHDSTNDMFSEQLSLQTKAGGALYVTSDTPFFEMERFLTEFANLPGLTTVYKEVAPAEIAGRLGYLEVGADGLVTDFIEKPAASQIPSQGLLPASVPIYGLDQTTLHQLNQHYAQQKTGEPPGRIIKWCLDQQIPVHAMKASQATLDIGKDSDVEPAKRLIAQMFQEDPAMAQQYRKMFSTL